MEKLDLTKRDNLITKNLATSFIERAEALKLKGKNRDDAALHYWCAASVTAKLLGNEILAHKLGTQAVLIIAIRGYLGVKELAL